MKPIVKWPGGKTQLLGHIRAMRPEKHNKYYEPFLGGGAVLLNLEPERATVNDLNLELINMYRQIKHAPDQVVSELREIDNAHAVSGDPKAFYYFVRSEYNQNLGIYTPEQAARLIYINKHCYNGLYRVNSRGLYNVSFNNKTKGGSFDENNIRQVSSYLQRVKILGGDFEAALDGVMSRDFVFLDSPYAPLNQTSFADYTKEGFGYKDHLRLAGLFNYLTKQGVYCMLTNHNTELVRSLYQESYIKVVQVARNINSNAAERKGEEVIITNYEPPCGIIKSWDKR